jgi:hypothetical protein
MHLRSLTLLREHLSTWHIRLDAIDLLACQKRIDHASHLTEFVQTFVGVDKMPGEISNSPHVCPLGYKPHEILSVICIRTRLFWGEPDWCTGSSVREYLAGAIEVIFV